MAIHPTSVISPEAKIHDMADIGPFCVVSGHTSIGRGTVLESGVSVGNRFCETEIGEENKIFPGAAVGGPPQDLSYTGQKTKLILGNRNTIRECVTINTGTPKGGGITRIGDDNLLMAYTHIAHDCIIENHVVIANSCQLAGHVEIEDHVKVGGVCCFNQFVRLGTHSYIAGDSAVNKDIMPYGIAQGKYAVVRATNKIGMERAGISKDAVEGVHKAIRILTKGTDTIENSLLRILRECVDSEELQHLIKFVKSSERGVAK